MNKTRDPRKEIEKFEELKKSFSYTFDADATHNTQDIPSIPPLTDEQKDMLVQLIEEQKDKNFGVNQETGFQKTLKRSGKAAYTDALAMIFVISVVGLITLLTMLMIIGGIK